jgi:hypothetical protein
LNTTARSVLGTDRPLVGARVTVEQLLAHRSGTVTAAPGLHVEREVRVGRVRDRRTTEPDLTSRSRDANTVA